jgi:large subunit ribosomal protein L13
MPTTTTRTFSPRPRDIERRWYVVDADGAVLGRLASEVAKILRGKHKPIFAPHVDTGDHVVVVNARGVRLTGTKVDSKVYYRHSGYPGGLTEIGYARLLSQRPAVAVEKAIRGMLPKNSLGRAMVRKLSVYEGPDHPHRAQSPSPLRLGEVPRWEGLPVPAPASPRASAPSTEKKESRRRPKTRDDEGRPTRSTAKKSTAKKSTAKKSTAKKSTAKSPARTRKTEGGSKAEKGAGEPKARSRRRSPKTNEKES